MGVAKRTRKFAQVKRVIGQRDARLKKNQLKGEEEAKKKSQGDEVIREMYISRSTFLLYLSCPAHILTNCRSHRPQVSSALFFQYNTALVPPYNVLIDTNFLSHTVQRKLELLPSMMDCLYASCRPIIVSRSTAHITAIARGVD